MAGIQVKGYGGTVQAVGGTTFRAAAVEIKPPEYGSLGIYRKTMQSGTMAAGLAADSPVFSFRWSHATYLGVVQKIILNGMGSSATGFTAGFANFRVYPARTFTASDSSGTAGTISGNNAKLRTNMATTSVGDIRISSTATLTAGTRTLDTDAIGGYAFTIDTTANKQFITPTVLFDGDMPLVLATNEGFVIQATVPATGTWIFGVTVHWAEVTAY